MWVRAVYSRLPTMKIVPSRASAPITATGRPPEGVGGGGTGIGDMVAVTGAISPALTWIVLIQSLYPLILRVMEWVPGERSGTIAGA